MSTEQDNFVQEYLEEQASAYLTQADELHADGVKLQEEARALPFYKPFKKMALLDAAVVSFRQAESMAKFSLGVHNKIRDSRSYG